MSQKKTVVKKKSASLAKKKSTVSKKKTRAKAQKTTSSASKRAAAEKKKLRSSKPSVSAAGKTSSAKKSTKRKSALTEIEDRWKSLMESLPSHVAILDKKGKIMAINKVAPGLTADDVLGKCFFDFPPKKIGNTMRAASKKVIATGEYIDIETSRRGADGIVTFWANRFGPLRHDNKIIGAIAIGTDITNRVMAEESLKESEQRFMTIF